MRIAFFISGFPIQGYLRDMLECLVKNGHKVDLYKTSTKYNLDTADLNTFSISINEIIGHDIFYRFLRLLDRRIFLLTSWMPNLSTKLLSIRFRRSIKNNKYDIFIGVEKIGLIIAWILNRRIETPYIYYSLELYIDDHDEINNFNYLRKSEIKANKHALATIIQDHLRAKALEIANKLTSHHFIYLPIGASEPLAKLPYKARTFRENILLDRFVILFVGILTFHRRIDELIPIAEALQDNEHLYLHGPSFLSIEQFKSTQNLTISQKTLSEDELYALVESSDIGVALYRDEPINDRLTAFSSHKIALYLKYAKPIIVPRNESYKELMGLYECGEMINNITDLPEAVRKIRHNYEHYSRQAILAFNHLYNLATRVPKAFEIIEHLIKVEH
ncbi:hypothetical protein IVG45_21930 [Methylomonas sp. LL1]|uniref:hypothetical protein n=1 Tax=Methylomonas sp. LL1 TaxID=2785785 RepID=UPI0018C41FEF|nr:hypothetical protein [Methylomonas sp. LL1]QPK63424.1 hypothetical protein IVG45_21930 [Methylomonas sp. LL1]